MPVFKIIAAPFTVIITVCKTLVTFTSGVNHLAEAFESTTKVAKNAALTWSEEEQAISEAKLSDLRKRIAEAKEQGIQYKRQDDDEIQL